MFIPKSLLFSLTREADWALLAAGLMCETVKTFVSSTLILTETHKLLQPLTTPTWCKLWKLVNWNFLYLQSRRSQYTHLLSTIPHCIYFGRLYRLNPSFKFKIYVSLLSLLFNTSGRVCAVVLSGKWGWRCMFLASGRGSALSRFWTKTSAKLWHFWLCCAPRLISSSLEPYLGFQELWLKQRRLWTVYGNTHPLRRLYGGIQQHPTFRHK